ncbi:anthrone oxygenase family protein [Aquamicrobium sp. LC103]|uniref:anthrone oxygenase family protein n=1 Tax=Aquamicrobium sp. LC103 TaxID=1120658 RepID=UPI00063EA21C|nr:anthrone oxygenase family protein [Aquamicrobium sp. LC103]TKT80226.1 DUF1772 domain-containing protein [Aquamicrobium sp. LC103]
MIFALELTAMLLVAVAMALSLAHALELPGKMRLSEKEYLAVQPIYYPGFTIAGAAEPLGIVALAVLAFPQPSGAAFRLTLGALVALAAAHLAYWLLTHPVNNFWLRETRLEGAGRGFFGAGPRLGGKGEAADWRALRNRWERSHVVRAVLSLASFMLLAAAIAA